MRSTQDYLRLRQAALARETEPDGTQLRRRRQRGGVGASPRQRFEKLPRLRVVVRIVVIEHGSSEAGGTRPAVPAGGGRTGFLVLQHRRGACQRGATQSS